MHKPWNEMYLSSSELNATVVSMWLPGLSCALGLNLMFLLKSHLLESYDMHGPPLKKGFCMHFLKDAHNLNKHTKKAFKRKYLAIVFKKKS